MNDLQIIIDWYIMRNNEIIVELIPTGELNVRVIAIIILSIFIIFHSLHVLQTEDRYRDHIINKIINKIF